jgi:hypothetical protein
LPRFITHSIAGSRFLIRPTGYGVGRNEELVERALTGTAPQRGDHRHQIRQRRGAAELSWASTTSPSTGSRDVKEACDGREWPPLISTISIRSILRCRLRRPSVPCGAWWSMTRCDTWSFRQRVKRRSGARTRLIREPRCKPNTRSGRAIRKNGNWVRSVYSARPRFQFKARKTWRTQRHPQKSLAVCGGEFPEESGNRGRHRETGDGERLQASKLALVWVLAQGGRTRTDPWREEAYLPG